MTRRQGTAQFVAGAALLALAGCGTVGLFGEYELPESAYVEDAPYPRLVDVPEAPPVGTYTASIPDPAEGARTMAELSAQAAVADVLAAQAAGPVVNGARSGLDAAVARARSRAAAPGGPLGAQEASRIQAAAASAGARAAALSEPVISDAEREALLARARAQRQTAD